MPGLLRPHPKENLVFPSGKVNLRIRSKVSFCLESAILGLQLRITSHNVTAGVSKLKGININTHQFTSTGFLF
jgi:hypothetical protein